MPLYEYQCECGKTFEEIQKFSDEPLIFCNCPDKKSVRKLMGSPSLHFSGGGWAKDGYQDKKPNMKEIRQAAIKNVK